MAAALTGSAAVSQLTAQFLEWVSAAPRTYENVIDTWRTSCPRLSIWEDALSGGLVEYRSGEPKTVVLTPLGREALGREPV